MFGHPANFVVAVIKTADFISRVTPPLGSVILFTLPILLRLFYEFCNISHAVSYTFEIQLFIVYDSYIIKSVVVFYIRNVLIYCWEVPSIWSMTVFYLSLIMFWFLLSFVLFHYFKYFVFHVTTITHCMILYRYLLIFASSILSVSFSSIYTCFFAVCYIHCSRLLYISSSFFTVLIIRVLTYSGVTLCFSILFWLNPDIIPIGNPY